MQNTTTAATTAEIDYCAAYGERTTVGFVPCGAEKTAEARPARDLYTSSTFRMQLAAAEANCDVVFIVSAKHGLVDPDEIVAPYDVKMGDPGSITADEIAAQAAVRLPADADVYAFLPAAYLAVVDEACRRINVAAQAVYEAAPGIGYQRGVCSIASR